TFHHTDGQSGAVAEGFFEIAEIKFGENGPAVGVDLEDDAMLAAQHPKFVLEPAKVGVVSSEKAAFLGEDFEVVFDPPRSHIHFDDYRGAAFVGDIEFAAANGDPLER